MPVFWPAGRGARNYAYELSDGAGLNTSSLLSGGKVADESGFGVIVDGIEVDWWFGAAYSQPGGFASTTTEVWVNLDFQRGLSTTLKTAIASSGAVTEIPRPAATSARGRRQASSRLTSSGSPTPVAILTKCIHRRQPAAYSSTTQGHSAGATLHWLQHEVWIVLHAGPECGKGHRRWL